MVLNGGIQSFAVAVLAVASFRRIICPVCVNEFQDFKCFATV